MPTPNAVIDQVVDGVVSLIQAAWSPTPPDAVSATDLNFEQYEQIQGMQILVFGAEYLNTDERPDRGEFQRDVTVAILALKRYTGTGDVPLTFTRQCRQIFETYVFNVLKDRETVAISVTQTVGAGTQTSTLWPEHTEESVPAYDPAILRQFNTFWCDWEITFRGILPI